MFEQAGFTDGEKDGRRDALSGKRHRPRPSLARSVLSAGYQSGYMAGYDKSWFNTKQAIVREDLREKKIRDEAKKTLSQSNTGTDKPFDMGWQHGFQGQASRSDRFRDNAETLAYQRGYKLGCRDRDLARAKALLKARHGQPLQKTHDHNERGEQDDLERDI